jgi:hypothetical protein
LFNAPVKPRREDSEWEEAEQLTGVGSI